MQNAASGPLVERMIGAARLNPATYEEVEGDTNATTSALLIVVLVAIASGIGNLRNADNAALGLIGGVVSSVVGWAVFAALAYYVGTKLFATASTSATIGQLLRTLGFAQTPGLLALLGFIPGVGPLVAFVGSVWVLVASVIALRHALDFTTGRAVGTAVVCWVIELVVVGIILAIFGLSIAGT